MPRTTSWEGIAVNQPNMNYVMEVICDLLSRQSGGRLEYSYTLTPKNSDNNNDNKKEEVKNNGKG